MKVKELIEILKNCNENSNVKLSIEKGRGMIGSEDFKVSEDEFGVFLSGEEDFNDDEDFDD